MSRSLGSRFQEGGHIVKWVGSREALQHLEQVRVMWKGPSGGRGQDSESCNGYGAGYGQGGVGGEVCRMKTRKEGK